MNRALQLMGLPAGTVVPIFASTDGSPLLPQERSAQDLGVTTDLDGDGTPGNELLGLIFDFDTGPGYNWNRFEATLRWQGTYYAVWPRLKAPSACQLLMAVGSPPTNAQQKWVFISGTDGKGVWQYADPGLEPVAYPTCP
jgi:hypothetical protein